MSAQRRRKSTSSISRPPSEASPAAMSLTRFRAVLSSPTPPPLMRSCWSRYLAIVQPRPSSPTRLEAGTRTSVKKVSFTWRRPFMVMIGRTSMPGAVIGKMRKEMPSCFFGSSLVRTRQKIQSAWCASEVQIFWPLMT